ncbi:MAG: hypothetical protein RIS92_350 [Verrucomicrobiota bacterium]
MTPSFGEVGAESVDSIECGSVRECGFRVTFPCAADGIESFESEADGVDAAVATGAAFVAGVAFDQLAFGEALGCFFRQRWDVFRGAWKAFTEEDFADPVSSKDGAGSGGAGLFGEGCGESENAASSVSFELVDALPVIAFHGDAVVGGKGCIKERVIRGEEGSDGGVGLDGVREEEDGFLEHGFAEGGEGWEVALTFFGEGCDVADVKPLATELGGESACAGIGQHATCLGPEGFGLRQCAGFCEGQESVVGGG